MWKILGLNSVIGSACDYFFHFGLVFAGASLGGNVFWPINSRFVIEPIVEPAGRSFYGYVKNVDLAEQIRYERWYFLIQLKTHLSRNRFAGPTFYKSGASRVGFERCMCSFSHLLIWDVQKVK